MAIFWERAAHSINIVFFAMSICSYRGYSNFLLNLAFISSSEVENIYIS